jgi:hypothetical protein
LHPDQLVESAAAVVVLLELAVWAQLGVGEEGAIRLALPAELAVAVAHQDQLVEELARPLVLYQALELVVRLAQLVVYPDQPVVVAALDCL